MKLQNTSIKDLVVLEPLLWKDDRGYFMESFNRSVFEKYKLEYNWVQDNEALSHRGVTRGLHYQIGHYAQAKLVRVIRGKVLDVAVDLRSKSKTYGEVYSIILSGENKLQLLIPRGFAHGYQVLEDDTIFAYKCDNYYSKNHEGGISPEDNALGIPWPLSRGDWIMSSKDQALPYFPNHISTQL